MVEDVCEKGVNEGVDVDARSEAVRSLFFWCGIENLDVDVHTLREESEGVLKCDAGGGKDGVYLGDALCAEVGELSEHFLVFCDAGDGGKLRICEAGDGNVDLPAADGPSGPENRNTITGVLNVDSNKVARQAGARYKGAGICIKLAGGFPVCLKVGNLQWFALEWLDDLSVEVDLPDSPESRVK
jgi:hypothetical protein